MGIIRCPECGRGISDSIFVCPKCGYKLKLSEVTALKESRDLYIKIFKIFAILFVSIFIFSFIALLAKPKQASAPPDDKAAKIAELVQEEVIKNYNTDSECRAVASLAVVRCTLTFPIGTNAILVEAKTKGAADRFAQVGRLASTIHYGGYSGSQKVCEYTYDPYSATVTRNFP